MADPFGSQASGKNRQGKNLRVLSPDDPFDPQKGKKGLVEKGEPLKQSSVFGAGEIDDDYTLSAQSLQDDDVARSSYSKFRLHKGEEVSVYNEEMDRRYGVDPRTKAVIVVAVVLALLVLVAVLVPNRATAAETDFSFAWLTKGIANSMDGLLAFFSGERPHDAMQNKLCLYLIVALAGAALGVSGAVYQGSLRNALASPTTLGVVSGGTLGLTMYVILCYDTDSITIVSTASETIDYYESLSVGEYLSETYLSVLFTLLGCFVVVGFVVGVALVAGHGKVSGPVLVITGQVMVTVITAVLNLVRTYYSTLEGSDGLKYQALQGIRSMSFSSTYTFLDLALMGVPVLIGVGIIIALRIRLNALTLDEEEARTLGLSVNGTRNLMVAACTLMTAVVIAFCGSISFVGFLVPHLTRRIVGPDFNYLIPASALVGASFLVLSQFLSSFLTLGSYGGARLISSVAGGVVFLVMAISGRGRSTADAF